MSAFQSDSVSASGQADESTMSKWSREFLIYEKTTFNDAEVREKENTESPMGSPVETTSENSGSFIEQDATINEILVVEEESNDVLSSSKRSSKTDGLSKDPGKWPQRQLTRNEINDAMERGVAYFKNKNPCPTKFIFYRYDTNAERTWLLFSPSKDQFFCFPCKVFRGPGVAARKILVERGAHFQSDYLFNKHEGSKQHKMWAEVYKNRLDSSRNVTSFFKKP